MFAFNTRNVLLAVGLVALGIALYFLAPLDDSCQPITTQAPMEGSQGYRVWEGETLKSFEHGGRKVCIPTGWESVGELSRGEGWATYERGTTGVVIRSDSWASIILTPKGSSYTVTLRYPSNTPAAFIPDYVNIVGHAFGSVGTLFADAGTEARQHTVLVTAGLAGNTVDDHSRVYPDTTARLTTFVRTPDQYRAAELLTHAVVHIYNRYQTDGLGYEANQAPFKKGDWQEVEAAWAELALNTSKAGRENRVNYLYNVHTAVRTNTVSLITVPPFNDRTEFAKITQSVVVATDADEIDYQYGHYVLGPLTLLGAEGLLIKYNAPVHVKDILIRIHTGEVTNFMDQLGTLLPKDQVDHVRAWVRGEESIPEDLVTRAVEYYDAHPQ